MCFTTLAQTRHITTKDMTLHLVVLVVKSVYEVSEITSFPYLLSVWSMKIICSWWESATGLQASELHVALLQEDAYLANSDANSNSSSTQMC